LLATQILWINLLTDTAPALAMSFDTPTDDVMSQPPRRMTDRLIDTEMQAVIRGLDRADFPELRRFQELQKNRALRAPEQVAELLFTAVERNSGNGLRYDIHDFSV